MKLKLNATGTSMNTSTYFCFILCIISACTIMCIVQPIFAAEDVNTPPSMTSNIAVTKISVYPETLAPLEDGTITATIKNIGKTPAQIEGIGVDGKEVIVTNDLKHQRNMIGVGDSRDFTFSFVAPGREGSFYPSLFIQTASTGFIRYPFKVKVEKAEPPISFISRSAPFNPGIETSITLQIGNPRSSTIRAVQIHPIYDLGAFESIIPNAIYIGDLSAGSASDAKFSITPKYDTTIRFVLLYMNGDNPHEVIYNLPVVLGQDKRVASPVLSNVRATAMGSSYQVSGSISNAGLENANGLIITPQSPARPIAPDRESVVGVLKPDDFSRTFTITFEADDGIRRIPLLITYKDNSGNVHAIEYGVDLPPPIGNEEKAQLAGITLPGITLQDITLPGITLPGIDPGHNDLIIIVGCIVVILAGVYIIYRLVRWKSN